MKLYLVQHGQACAKEVDPNRPLTRQGQADMEQVAAFLKQAGIQVERVIHSGKLRAEQTAQILAESLCPGVTLEARGSINPNGNPKDFQWQSESRQGDTLMVGHLPFMAKLVSHLLGEDENKLTVAYEPGTVVCLEFNESSNWQINWMIRPELLK